MFNTSFGDIEPNVHFDPVTGQALLARIMAVGKNLPILHNPNSNKIRYVLHFTRDTSIQRFREDISLAWADVVCANITGIKEITNDPQPKDYKALYILRIGLKDEESCLAECDFFSGNEHNIRACCGEYSLKHPVKPGDFGSIPITLNSNATAFI